jgi:hypothetical protein
MAMPHHNHLNRPLADGIRKVGFRKWYERELLSSHAHMLLTILCALALMGILEVFHDAGVTDKLLDVGLFILSAAMGVWALRRYLYLLVHAETVADQANCPQCAAYGRLSVVEEDRRNGQLLVKCNKCSHEWTLRP